MKRSTKSDAKLAPEYALPAPKCPFNMLGNPVPVPLAFTEPAKTLASVAFPDGRTWQMGRGGLKFSSNGNSV